jgi:ribonuclease-3
MNKLESIKKDFKNKNILLEALTHRSWRNENKNKRNHNERLEFLGDAVLELVVTDFIFRKLPKKPEGILTILRGKIVNTTNLAKVAKSLSLGKALYIGKGEEKEGGRKNTSLLANSVEALIGAIYLDQGYEKAEHFINENILHDFDEKLAQPLKDNKSTLQETVQSKKYPAPKYKVLSQKGPDHNKIYIVGVYVNHKKIGEGKGSSKSRAEQEAAKSGLVTFQSKD